MKAFHSSLLLSLFSILLPVNSQLAGITQQDIIDEAEHLLVDNTGTNSVAFVSAVSPCSNYVGFASDPANRGEQTSAQWVRFAFHDFVTADVAAGTGGLDASLGFESDRAENAGLFVNDTLKFMENTTSAYLSAADHIALGVLAAVTECGGNAQAIPVSVGRIDATAAGPSGVPGPFTALQTALDQFGSAGFTQNETIALTLWAFVGALEESAVTPKNLDGGVGFDSTPTVVDADGMNAYLDGSSVDPLVDSFNVSARFDQRLYSSDNNVTIKALAQDVRGICPTVFTKMLNTVPSTVKLSDPITPMTWKAVDVQMHIDDGGSVGVCGLIRNLGTTTAPGSTVTYTIGNSSDIQTSDPSSGTGSGIFGTTTYFPFSSDIDEGTTSLDVQCSSFTINDNIFIIPDQSSVDDISQIIVVKAAILTSLTTPETEMTAVLYVPVPQEGSVSLKIVQQKFSMALLETAGDYTLYQASERVSNLQNVIAGVSLGSSSSQTVKTSLFSGCITTR